MSPDVPRNRLRRATLTVWRQLPFFVWLIALWMLLWGQFTWLAFLTGLIAAVIVTRIFRLPPVELSEMHMDPPDPLPYFGEHLVLRDLPAAAIDDFVAAAGHGSGSTLASVEIRHVGGALGRGGEGHGALDRLPGEFVYFGIGMASDEAEDAATRRDLHRVTGSLRPYRSGSYLNFEEEAADPASFYGDETYRRLRLVKAAVDPDELFLANHPIPPADRS